MSFLDGRAPLRLKYVMCFGIETVLASTVLKAGSLELTLAVINMAACITASACKYTL